MLIRPKSISPRGWGMGANFSVGVCRPLLKTLTIGVKHTRAHTHTNKYTHTVNLSQIEIQHCLGGRGEGEGGGERWIKTHKGRFFHAKRVGMAIVDSERLEKSQRYRYISLSCTDRFNCHLQLCLFSLMSRVSNASICCGREKISHC